MCATLTMSNDKDNHNIALKLHRQFAHPSKEKLLQLKEENAGEPWLSNQHLIKEIKNVTDSLPNM